jgi:hypothetical protein
MQNESTSQPELTCQWCIGIIPENELACASCGAARPREDLVAPGYLQPEVPSTTYSAPAASQSTEIDDEVRARQILKDLNAYVPEEKAAPARPTRDMSDDALVVIIVLAGSGVFGGLVGWFLAPPLIYDLFNDVLGVDTDGPEAFRRLGGFVGALVAMLFGSMLVAFMRR